jgi:hypothetical protein
VKVVVGEIPPLASVVAISPINVIPVILLLFARGGRPIGRTRFWADGKPGSIRTMQRSRSLGDPIGQAIGATWP